MNIELKNLKERAASNENIQSIVTGRSAKLTMY